MSVDRTEGQTPQQASEQAAEFFGFAASEKIKVQGPDGTVEVFEVPNPALLNDDQQERWDALQFDIQQCDRLPGVDIPAHKLQHKVTEGDRVEEDETFVPARTIRGELIQPYRKTQSDGAVVLMSPPYNARVAIALWGEDGYARFRAGGGNSRLIGLIWSRMEREVAERKAVDSKSGGSIQHMEAVPTTD